VKINTLTGVSIVIANMVGTGAFTSLGFQLVDLKNPNVVLTLWVMGGVLAISGAFSYAEVGTVIKKSGGEYAFLSQTYNPLIGYLSGWISLSVGFAAPIALSAIAFVEYFPIKNIPVNLIGILLIAIVTYIHTRNLKTSSKFQNISTFLKVGLILVFIAIGSIYPSSIINSDTIVKTEFFSELFSPAFAVALIYVSYSYSGWNAAAYTTEEFSNPRKSLPIALVGGTLLVMVLYTLLQFVFLKHVPIEELKGQLNVGTLAAQHILGNGGGTFFSAAISLLLISGISAMVWVGSRVSSSIANDYKLWSYLRTDADGIPRKALWLQCIVSSAILLTGTFEQILVYCGVLLSISSMLVVFAVFKIRKKSFLIKNNGYKSPLFPFFQILFLLLSLWMIIFAFISHTTETIAGMGNLLIGIITYLLGKKFEKTKREEV